MFSVVTRVLALTVKSIALRHYVYFFFQVYGWLDSLLYVAVGYGATLQCHFVAEVPGTSWLHNDTRSQPVLHKYYPQGDASRQALCSVCLCVCVMCDVIDVEGSIPMTGLSRRTR